MARQKKVVVVPPLNKKEAEKVLANYADSDAKIQQIEAALDEQFAKLREEKADMLQDLNDKRSQAFQKMQMYAETNPTLFERKKSLDMSQGKIGFRTGTPKLKTRKGFTWNAVLNLLKNKKRTDYIKVTEAPEKARLLADREVPEVITLMSEVGVEVVQDETFYIELKKEELTK